MQPQIVRMHHVVEQFGVTRKTVYDWIRKGAFPRPFKLVNNGNVVGWLQSDIDTLIADRVAERDQQHTSRP